MALATISLPPTLENLGKCRGEDIVINPEHLKRLPAYPVELNRPLQYYIYWKAAFFKRGRLHVRAGFYDGCAELRCPYIGFPFNYSVRPALRKTMTNSKALVEVLHVPV